MGGDGNSVVVDRINKITFVQFMLSKVHTSGRAAKASANFKAEAILYNGVGVKLLSRERCDCNR